MKQDIRKLFDTEETKTSETLPHNHREEFLKKLKERNFETKRSYYWLKVAAIVVLSLSVGFTVYYNNFKSNEVSLLIAQIEAVEAEYLESIEQEWESFIAIAEDKVLVERFKNKLDELNEDYHEISAQFRNDPNNVLTVENLIDNLQTRLQILKDIQEHIKILNQNNERYEKSI